MTPQQASELLDGDFKTETHPEWVGAVQADFDSFSGAYIRATPGHEALYEAAQEMAETVAELRYEYAVQVRQVDTWGYLVENDGLVNFETDDDCAEWVTDIKYAQYLSGITRRHNRIVRRLVSSPEVVE